MKPYYEDKLVTIYTGDSLGLLPLLAPGMVVVTDQPYGTGWVRGGGKKVDGAIASRKRQGDLPRAGRGELHANLCDEVIGRRVVVTAIARRGIARFATAGERHALPA